MIVYRVACTMNQAIAKDWEDFFLEEHLSDVVNTGYFHGYSFQKEILEDNSKEVTYVAEYYAPNIDSLEAYNKNAASRLKQDVIDKFGGQFSVVRTIAEVIGKS